jgi:hypothetical protein
MSITVKDLSNMNRWIIAITLLVIPTLHAFGQGGVFEFSNVGTTPDRHIYVGEYMGPVKAEGPGYQIAIFYGPEGTSDDSALVQLGASIGFLTQGQFSGGVRPISSLDPGPVFAFQARAWDSSTGDATWAQAVANPNGRYGKGPVFDMKTKDPFDPSEQTPKIGEAAGWRGFAIIPEPSVWGIALLGAAGLLLFRRR